jgi:PAS domain S-box-containing protein
MVFSFAGQLYRKTMSNRYLATSGLFASCNLKRGDFNIGQFFRLTVAGRVQALLAARWLSGYRSSALRYFFKAGVKLANCRTNERPAVENIEPLKILNRQLAESRLRLQTILQLSPIGIAITRLSDGAILDFNEALLAIIGYERTEVIGRTSAELAIWSDPAQRAQAFSKITAGESIREMPMVIRRKNGELRQGRLSAAVVQLDGEAHAITNLRDVSDEIAAEQEREKVARHLQSTLDSVPSMIGYWDRNLRNHFANHAYQDWFGIDPKKAPGMHIRQVIGDERYRLNLPYIEGALRGEKLTFERCIPSPDGSHTRHSLAEYIPDIVDGEVQGFYALVSDITPIKQAEFALRESEERYRKVVEDQTEVICRYLPDGTMIFVNEVYCRFFGKSEAELSGLSWHPVAHPDDIPMIEEKLSSLSPSNPVVTIENRVYAADGSEHWMQFVNRAFYGDDGKLQEIQSVGRDISARKLAEQELAASRAQLHALLAANDHVREAQRKEMAREIHDQLGSSLTSIGFRVDALNRQLGDAPQLADEVARIKSLVSQASLAARNICDRLRPPALDDLGLIPTCRWYLQDWSGLAGVQAKGRFGPLRAELSEQLSTDLFRVFQELLTNVAKHSGASSVRVSISCTAHALRLQVVDDGGGFGAEQTIHGYGLAGIRERMARHGGELTIKSEPGATAVTIAVPLEIEP